MRTLTDSEIVRAIRKGSAEAADALFERHRPRVWKATYAVLGERAAADDAAQRAIERAIRALDQFHTDRSFGAWIARIAVNQAIDTLRRTPNEWPLPEALSAPDDYDEILERDALVRAVSSLDADRRAVVALRYWLDMDPPEIAVALGIPVGPVSSRLSRALSELRVSRRAAGPGLVGDVRAAEHLSQPRRCAVGGRYPGGPMRRSGLVGDGIERVVASDGTATRVINNGFTIVPGDAARSLHFTGPVGSFTLPIQRASDEPPRFRPDRWRERELIGLDLARGGHASIRVAPNIGGGRCDWLSVRGRARSTACSRPGDPQLPYDVVTGGFIRRVNRIPSLFEGRFAPGVGAVEIVYADGARKRLTPTEGYVLYEVRPERMTPEQQAVSVTTFDREGIALVRERVRSPRELLRPQQGGP